MEVQTLESIGALGTAFATIAIVLLLWKAVRQMEATVALSKVQTDFRFRAWIGPAGSIEYREIDDDKSRFSIAIIFFWGHCF